MLSSDLAELYGVEARALLQAAKRNLDRFPSDFMFQLTWDEVAGLQSSPQKRSSRSQSVILKRGHNPKYLPYAFTEQGVAMLSSVLRSQRAVHVNIAIMRAFVQLRRMLLTHGELSEKLAGLERKYDIQFKVVFDAIRELMNPPTPRRRTIGFARP